MSYLIRTPDGATSAQTYTNRLADFESYSYYHVIAMCDSDETAIALMKSTEDMDVWLHYHGGTYVQSGITQTGTVIDLGKYSTKEIGNGKYCVMVNGSTDADVVINKLNIITVASAGATNNDRNTSLATEGTMEIIEPKGVTFLNTMVLCANALERDPANVVYVLKTFFVGYTNGRIETITDVAPFRFLITDATGSFTESGGEYHINFMAMSNGVSRLPQYDKLHMSAPLSGNTLANTVNTLQQYVNDSYQDMFDCVYKQVQRTETSFGYEAGELSDNLTRVEYVIELDDCYKTSQYSFNPSYVGAGSTASCSSSAQTNTGTDFSIESALHHMMLHCARVEKDASEGIQSEITIRNRVIKAGTKIQYKIHTNVQVQPVGNKTSHIITYTVRPYPIPRDLISLAVESDSNTVDDEVGPQTLRFEYLYTGKNIDILELDIKLNQGLAYLQLATVNNTFKTPGAAVPGRTLVSDTEQIKNQMERAKPTGQEKSKVSLPVFFSTNLEIPNRRTTMNPVNTADNIWNMTKQASIEMLEVSMKITGNLILMNSALAAADDYDTTNSAQGVPNIDWGVMPSFAKVNIRMPASNDDISLFNSQEQTFTTEFWFDGYYYITGVEHVFDEGSFIQNVQLISMPKMPNQTGKRVNSEMQATFSTDVLECYNNPKCGSPSESGRGETKQRHNTETVSNAPGVKTAESLPVPSQIPATAMDKIVSNMSADNVQGWNELPAEVKDAITTETKGSKIPLSTYAAIASIESNGNPRAISKTGSAGIFQFTKRTWNSVMPNNKITRTNDPRRDPQLNARAARLYIEDISKILNGTTDPTWLYMGHNLGPYAARAVMKTAGTGNCRLMRDIYTENKFRPDDTQPAGPEQWDNFARSNGYFRGSGADTVTTTCTIRDLIAGKYKKRLKTTNIEPSPATAQTTPKVDQNPKVNTRDGNQNVHRVSSKCKTTNDKQDSNSQQPSTCATAVEPNSKK